jgi:hypothetical protein
MSFAFVGSGPAVKVLTEQYLNQMQYPKGSTDATKRQLACMIAQAVLPCRVELQNVENRLEALEREIAVCAPSTLHKALNNVIDQHEALKNIVKTQHKDVTDLQLGLDGCIRLQAMRDTFTTFEQTFQHRLTMLHNMQTSTDRKVQELQAAIQSSSARDDHSVPPRGRGREAEADTSASRMRALSPLMIPVYVPGGPEGGKLFPHVAVQAMLRSGDILMREGHPSYELFMMEHTYVRQNHQ